MQRNSAAGATQQAQRTRRDARRATAPVTPRDQRKQAAKSGPRCSARGDGSRDKPAQNQQENVGAAQNPRKNTKQPKPAAPIIPCGEPINSSFLLVLP